MQERVAWALDRQGLGWTALAKRIGITEQALRKMIANDGGRSVRKDGSTRIEQIARILGVRVPWLTIGELPAVDQPEPRPDDGDESEDAEILAFLRDARTSAKALLSRLAALESQVAHLEEQLALERADDETEGGPPSRPAPDPRDGTGSPPAQPPRTGAPVPRSSGR